MRLSKGGAKGDIDDYDPPPMVEETLPKVSFADVPKAVMAAKQMTIMRASITAYSTAVGPSSVLIKSSTSWAIRANFDSSSLQSQGGYTRQLNVSKTSAQNGLG